MKSEVQVINQECHPNAIQWELESYKNFDDSNNINLGVIFIGKSSSQNKETWSFN